MTEEPSTYRIRGVRAAARGVRRLFAFARPHLWLVVVMIIATSIASAAEGARAYVLQRVLVDVFGVPQVPSWAEGAQAIPDPGTDRLAEAWNSLIWLSLATAGLAVTVALFGFIHRYISSYLTIRLIVDIQNAVGRHLLSLSLRFFSGKTQGDLYARLGSDIGSTQQALTLLFSAVFVHPFKLIFYAAWALYFSWELALLVILLAPTIVLPLRRFGKVIRRSARSRQKSVAGVFDALHQMLSGIRIVKAFHREDHAFERLQERNATLLGDAMRVVRARVMSRSVVEGINNLLVPIVIIAGGWLVLEGRTLTWLKEGGIQLSIPQLAAFTFAVMMMYEPAKGLIQAYNTLQESLAGTERVFEVLDTEPDLTDAPDARDLPGVREEIRFEGIDFAYEDEVILKGIDLTARVGEITAIVGPTGAGKSTLLDLIPRFYDPGKGRITIDGTDLREVKRASLLRHIAVVTQEPFLFNETILENIRYGRPDATREEVEAAAKAANIHDAIVDSSGRFAKGYDTVVGDRGGKLSGGERQRITIARALLRDASILILDEATSSLDSESEALVQEALDRLMKGRTTFVIAHRLSTVRNAHKIVALEDGRICEQGTHEELIAKGGLYHRLYTMQRLDGAEPEDGNGTGAEAGARAGVEETQGLSRGEADG